jgi:formylglycine-generating enzyme required for sulfatase activity
MNMKKNLFFMGMISLVLIFGIMILGCDNPSIPKDKLGTISGKVLFTGQVAGGNSGISISLEPIDDSGRSAAVRSVNSGARSIGMARAITARDETSADGTYTLTNVPYGTYTIYASSDNSKEKAVSLPIKLNAKSVQASDLFLTAVGSLSGKVTLDGEPAFGFLVSIAGTSYMAVTDGNGEFTISDIPAANQKYLIVVMKGNYTGYWDSAEGNTIGETVVGGATLALGTKALTAQDLYDGADIRIDAETGNWFINGVDTGISAKGEQGDKGDPGEDGSDGTNGSVVTIGDDGYWYIDGVKTDVKAEGIDGADGSVITIGDDGYWYIDGENTGVRAYPFELYYKMVLVEGGLFNVGENYSEHNVMLSDFFIGKYEVTQEQYEAVMGANPSYFDGDNLPVEQVSWYDAIVFCNTLSIKEELDPAYSIDGETDPELWGEMPTSTSHENFAIWNAVVCDFTANGYRLPTEAEWEYAARGGQKSEGYEYAGSDAPDEVAWHSANSGSTTHNVGTKKANELGLYDMSGNVYEWCWDWLGSYPSGNLEDDYAGASLGAVRVLCGGDWLTSATSLLSAIRGFHTPDFRDFSYGFRVVRSKF